MRRTERGFFLGGGEWWKFKSPTYQLSSAAHKRQLRPRPLTLDRGLLLLIQENCSFQPPGRRSIWDGPMEIEMFHGGKMNRCIIIQMHSHATQSLGVKCANASLCANPTSKEAPPEAETTNISRKKHYDKIVVFCLQWEKNYLIFIWVLRKKCWQLLIYEREQKNKWRINNDGISCKRF